MSGTPLDQFIAVVNPKGCHLINLPNRIWVFGGPVAENTQEPSESLRDSFWRHTLNAIPPQNWFVDLDRPENHQGWWAFSGYDDLLEFERDACYLARKTILFSESPGAHAELGALALDDSILPRLFVVVQNQYLNEGTRESFLNLGPIKRALNKGARCVIDGSGPKNLTNDDFEAIVDSFNAVLGEGEHNRVSLQLKNPTHRLLLIADLVDLFLVSKAVDIQKALSHFEIEIHIDSLAKELNLLSFFNFVRLEFRGNEPFWVRSPSSDSPWVDYKANSGNAHFDRGRFKVVSQTYVEADKRLNYIFKRSA